MSLFGKNKEEEPEEEEDQEDTYTMNLECGNCNDCFDYDIKKGMTVSEFKSKKKCPTCDCFLDADEYNYTDDTEDEE